MMAVTLAEAQSIMLLIRGGKSVLKTTNLAIVLASNGSILASTDSYNYLDVVGCPDATSGARQLMRFFNNDMGFSHAEVAHLLPYARKLQPVQRLRYYSALLRCRRRERDCDGQLERGDWSLAATRLFDPTPNLSSLDKHEDRQKTTTKATNLLDPVAPERPSSMPMNSRERKGSTDGGELYSVSCCAILAVVILAVVRLDAKRE
eukprot:SAG31_NODE_357_length_17115_cov_64.211801_9_plen_205_part_00